MPARSKVEGLPDDIRVELDRRLVAGAFSGYAQLADWLTEQGHPISHAAVHRHGAQLERKIEAIRVATEQAKALVAGSPDSEGAFSEATIRMAQERIFQLLKTAGDDANFKEVTAAAKAIAEMARASISVAAERRQAREEALQKVDSKLQAAEDAADASDDPREVIARIRRDIYGIHDD